MSKVGVKEIYSNVLWILMLNVLRACNSKSILKKVYKKIEKILTTFSIIDKTFLKKDLLMYAYINQNHVL